eukprot:6184024-Pleurochrysis_carterae.AAC.3
MNIVSALKLLSVHMRMRLCACACAHVRVRLRARALVHKRVEGVRDGAEQRLRGEGVREAQAVGQGAPKRCDGADKDCAARAACAGGGEVEDDSAGREVCGEGSRGGGKGMHRKPKSVSPVGRTASFSRAGNTASELNAQACVQSQSCSYSVPHNLNQPGQGGALLDAVLLIQHLHLQAQNAGRRCPVKRIRLSDT